MQARDHEGGQELHGRDACVDAHIPPLVRCARRRSTNAPIVDEPVIAAGPDPRRPAIALALIGSAVALGPIVTFLSGAWPYALAVAWVPGGIILANRSRTTLAGTALAGTLTIAFAVVVPPAIG